MELGWISLSETLMKIWTDCEPSCSKFDPGGCHEETTNKENLDLEFPKDWGTTENPSSHFGSVYLEKEVG